MLAFFLNICLLYIISLETHFNNLQRLILCFILYSSLKYFSLFLRSLWNSTHNLIRMNIKDSFLKYTIYFIHKITPSTYSRSFRLYHHLSKSQHFQGEKWNRTERLLGLHDGVEKERKGRQSRDQPFGEEFNK